MLSQMPDSENGARRARPMGRLTQILTRETPARVLLQVVREKFRRDNVKQCAASLSYSTLASLVPIFAIIITILSGPAFESKREVYLNYVISHLILQPD